jgi:hypothetical protein
MNPKIKIGIDITNLPHDYFGGVDTYSRGLIDGFYKSDSNTEYQIYLNKNYFLKRRFKEKKNFNFFIIEQSSFKKVSFKIYNRIFPYISIILFDYKYCVDFYCRNYFNSDFKKIVKKNSDILVVPNTYLSFYDLKLKTILNIHDLQHLHFSENFSKHEFLMRNYQYYNSAKYSSKLISSSNFIKKDLLKNYKFLKKKDISVITEGVNLKQFNNNLKTKKTNNFFFPAQLWSHKNHKLVVDAFKYLDKNLKIKANLLFCGKKFEKSNELFEYIKKNKIHNVKYLGLVSFQKLKKLYKESYCVLCPAIYESSSLTLLEAIASKTSVIASDNKPNIEKKKIFKINIFKKNDLENLVGVLKKVCKGKIFIKKQVKFNSIRIKNFDWNIISQQYLKVILKIL